MSVIVPTPIPTPTPYRETLQDLVWNTFFANIWLFVWIISAVIIIGFVIWLIIRQKNKSKDKVNRYADFSIGKFKIIMYRKIGDKYHEIDRKKIDVTKQKWRYNNKDFTTFDIKNIAFSDKNNNYYAFDYDNGAQLNLHTKGMPKNISVEDVDTYVNRSIIAQLVAGLEELKNTKGQWIFLILGLAIGLSIGIVIGIYISPSIMHTPTPTATPQPFIGVG